MNSEQLKQLETELWAAADNLRANSDLKSSEYATPVLGLIFLKFADNNYRRHEAEIMAEYAKHKGKRTEKKLSEIAIEKCGFYLPDNARYEYLLNLPEEEDIAKKLKNAMEAIEAYKPELSGVLPQEEYFRLTRNEKTRTIPNELLKHFADIPGDAGGDLFGQIYEYFLGKFALAEGQGGGEFFTPRSVVRLMVEIIEPHRGKVFDPACGSGGMFVQSAHFIEQHRKDVRGGTEGDIYVQGQEKTLETVKLAKMNLAVNGLRGEVRQSNTYYEDPYNSVGAFDYVLANPPFNVDDVALEAVENDPRFNAFGVPRNKTKAKKSDKGKETVPNGNYLWISLFATSLNAKGRAALVMANSASDARHSEADIRRTLIENNLIYGMLTLPTNMFYTVTLPATLWFFDKAKNDDRILFIDARNIFTPIDRAHREFSEEQIQDIAIISRLHKGRREEFVGLIDRYFASGMATLLENRKAVEPVSEQLIDVLDDANGRAAVSGLVEQWRDLDRLDKLYKTYVAKHAKGSIDARNKYQHSLRETFDPFFAGLHDGLKKLDRIVREHDKHQSELAGNNGKRGTQDRKSKQLKDSLKALHVEVKNAERYHIHVRWLQGRFPDARYENVTGLCKLATIAEVAEQDWSLNPGRYVGVVIEDDGLTQEEFIEQIEQLKSDLDTLVLEGEQLSTVISTNLERILSEG